MTVTWRALLLPVLVFGAASSVLLWLLLSDRLVTEQLAWRLGLGIGLALAASLITTFLVQRRLERTAAEPLVDAARTASRLLDPADSELSAGASDESFEALAARLAEINAAVARRVRLLDSERQHLLTVLESLSEGVLVTGAEGDTLLVNRRWRQLFELTDEASDRTALELARQTELDGMITETLASAEPQQIELEITRARRRTVILTSSPLTGGVGLVVLAHDLTPFLRAGEIRRDFVANVSHELKTPLSAIRGFAETLVDGAIDDPPAASRFTRRILKQCKRLEALLSDLLTLSRLEHPEARTGWGQVDLAAIVGEAVDLTSEAATERGIELELAVHPVSPIEGDPEALVRMCINLLENAIKYNRQDGQVRVLLEQSEAAISLEVSDTGIGIPREAVQRLFERFYRVDKGRSRAEGGTGLGLAIVKHAAQLHGGTVEVDSELGGGSRFRVFLPLQGTDDSVAAL
jgi:two-component system phosphate regulon sensor histidine kinase PhoR